MKFQEIPVTPGMKINVPYEIVGPAQPGDKWIDDSGKEATLPALGIPSQWWWAKLADNWQNLPERRVLLCSERRGFWDNVIEDQAPNPT